MRIYFNSVSALRHARQMGVPITGARVIHSAIKIDDFPYSARYCITEPVKILVPGRIKPEKGTQDAILLLEELKRRGIPARLKLVGKIQSAPYFSDILAMIYQKGLGDSVEYIPMVTQADLSFLYQEADICFFPTYFKTGFSRVPLEAMSSGCLVICYGNEGSREVIRDGISGFVIPEGDIERATRVINNFIKEPALYKKVIQEARNQVEREHTLDKYIDSIETYLQSSLSQNDAGSWLG
jgi:colanic acid/amylovoran biosynthesis glycosyltransferase